MRWFKAGADSGVLRFRLTSVTQNSNVVLPDHEGGWEAQRDL